MRSDFSLNDHNYFYRNYNEPIELLEMSAWCCEQDLSIKLLHKLQLHFSFHFRHLTPFFIKMLFAVFFRSSSCFLERTEEQQYSAITRPAPWYAIV